MQVLHAGSDKLIWLELEETVLRQAAEEAGYQCSVEDRGRSILLNLTASDREGPLLLFDAADSGNTGWFSRCQFYVDGRSGGILQTPFFLSNVWDGNGRPLSQSIGLLIAKEVPMHFRLPGRQAVSEKVVYAVLHNFLTALATVGVGLCGPASVRPLAGRLDIAGARG
jgi:hypothetical protein